MAVVAGPVIDFGGALEPKSQGALVTDQTPSAPTYGPTSQVLASPAFNQLINEKATGTPF